MDRTSTPMVNQATCVDDGRDERRRGEGSEHGDGDDFHKARIGQEKTRLFAIRSEMREWNHHAHDADRRQAPRHTGLDTQSTISALPSLVCQVQLLARRRRSGRRTLGPWVCRRRESAGGDSDRKKRRVEHSRSVARSNTGATLETSSNSDSPCQKTASSARFWFPGLLERGQRTEDPALQLGADLVKREAGIEPTAHPGCLLRRVTRPPGLLPPLPSEHDLGLREQPERNPAADRAGVDLRGFGDRFGRDGIAHGAV